MLAIRLRFDDGFSLLYALSSCENSGDVSEQGIAEASELSLVSCFLPQADRREFIRPKANEDYAEWILREAGEHRTDLIAIDRIERLPNGLLCFFVERITRTAPSPVLAVWADNYKNASSSGVFRILVATDFSIYSEQAFKYGLRLAQAQNSELYLLHVLAQQQTGGAVNPRRAVESGEPYHKAMRSLQSLKADKSASGIKVEVEVRMGEPYREILSCAREKEVDLLCIGSYGKDSGEAGLFGSNTDRILRQAPCPVLLARPLKPLLNLTF
ncbi:MAG TPA: universal stress protein [Blastocatellia bacterium]|nr:universal stress protein [Blastocatellia bacterium]